MPIPRACLAVLSSMLLLGLSAAAQAENGCGCEQPACRTCYPQNVTCAPRCRAHCHHGCRHGYSDYAPPVGPIMESAPMVRMMPIVSAPMYETRRIAYADDVSYVRVREVDDRSLRVAPRSERTCEASTERLDSLETRVDRLTTRVDTLQETLGEHYKILSAIKTKLDNMADR